MKSDSFLFHIGALIMSQFPAISIAGVYTYSYLNPNAGSEKNIVEIFQRESQRDATAKFDADKLDTVHYSVPSLRMELQCDRPGWYTHLTVENTYSFADYDGPTQKTGSGSCGQKTPDESVSAAIAACLAKKHCSRLFNEVARGRISTIHWRTAFDDGLSDKPKAYSECFLGGWPDEQSECNSYADGTDAQREVIQNRKLFLERYLPK